MTTPDLPVDPGLVAAAAALEPAEAVARHAALAAEVTAANRAYYVEDAPTLSDAEYDAKLRELVALEAAFPALRTADSPTQRVGAPEAGEASPFGEVRHERPDAQPRATPSARRSCAPSTSGCGEGWACRPRPSPPRSCATSPSSRSTASPSACGTARAGSSGVPPGATGPPART